MTISVRAKLLLIIRADVWVSIDPACDDGRKWNKKYLPFYVIPGMIKKYFRNWVIQSSQTQEWPTFERFLTTAMHSYWDLKRSLASTPASCCVFCEFLKSGRRPSVVRSRMHFVPKWSTTYLQCHIVLSFTEYSSVDRVELLLLWPSDKSMFYEALIKTLIFFGIVRKGAVIFSKKVSVENN